MAAKIRLKRGGRKGQPSYRLVVLDGQKPRDAKVVADLGFYDPKTNPATFEVDSEAALQWLLDGAKATRAARGVLSKAGVMAAWDAAKRGEEVVIEPKDLQPTPEPAKEKAATAKEPEKTPAEEEKEPPAEAAAAEEAPAEDVEDTEEEEPGEAEPAEEETSEEEPADEAEEEAEKKD